MPRNEWYRQCKLRRPVGSKGPAGEGTSTTQPLDGSSPPYQEMVSWIPADLAIEGKVVKLKEFHRDKEFSENWTVISAGPKRPGKTIEENADLWKHQREVSDV